MYELGRENSRLSIRRFLLLLKVSMFVLRAQILVVETSEIPDPSYTKSRLRALRSLSTTFRAKLKRGMSLLSRPCLFLYSLPCLVRCFSVLSFCLKQDIETHNRIVFNISMASIKKSIPCTSLSCSTSHPTSEYRTISSLKPISSYQNKSQAAQELSRHHQYNSPWLRPQELCRSGPPRVHQRLPQEASHLERNAGG